MKKMLLGKGKWVLTGLMSLLVVIGVALCFFTTVNYDLSKYLPADSRTKEGLELLEERFGLSTAVQIMTEDVSLGEASQLADKLQNVDGISAVVWLGTVADPTVPLEQIDSVLLDRFYIDGALLFTITLNVDSYDRSAENILQGIQEAMSGTPYSIRGEAIDNIESRRVAADEIFKVLLIVVPIAVIVLILVGRSWFEPILILVSLAIAVALNMGTNVFLGSVSYITMTMAMALQLALSLDYSIFLLHRYHEERDEGASAVDAIHTATKKMFGSVTGSAFTTIAGFLALLLMRYTIGFDIGLVLSKGIFFSYLTTILFLPVLLYFAAPLMEKTAHKAFLERGLGKIRRPNHRSKGHFILVGSFVVLTLAAWCFQKQNTYLYGNSAVADPESVVTIDRTAIKERFGPYAPIVVMAEDVSLSEERAFLEAISDSPYVLSIEALSQIVDSSIPREWIPTEYLDHYVSGSTTRIIVMIEADQESDAMYSAVEFLQHAADQSFGTAYLVGYAPATSEIRSTILADSNLVLWVTFLAIAFVILILFRNVSAPILLTLVIQAAVWMNFAVIGLEGSKTLYIGYLIVTALQMGGTVDYGILLTSRYLDLRKEHNPGEAIRLAKKKSTVTILTSSVVLASAGFAEALISRIPSVSGIGTLIGRGAILSAVLILLFLPSILIVFDKFLTPKSKSILPKGELVHE